MSSVPIGAWLRSLFLEAVPGLSIFALMMLTTLPVGMAPHLRIGGLLPLVGISYWSLVRPRAMTLPIIFFLGVLTDILLFTPIGVHAFIFVLSQMVLRKQRRFLAGQGFWVMWAAFALLLFVSYNLLWSVLKVITGGVLAYERGLIAAGMAWAVLPFLAGILSMLHDLIDLFDEPVL
jgi:rod shape-determining protein MreD